MTETRINRRILLARRPQGAPRPEDFRLDTQPVPEPKEGEVLLRALYLSLDPYMRGRMSDAESYVEPVPVGGVMAGGTVARVEVSHHPDYAVGDLVHGYTGWQDYALSDGSIGEGSRNGLVRLPPDLARPSLALGVLGMPGFTAYVGLLKIGRPEPGETVVVAAATGAVGSVVGQVAKLKGCRAVGIAGGAEKCRFAVEALGFDICIDHRAPDFAARLTAACPDGIDVYYENVGGAVFKAVLPLINVGARIPLCGLIAHYNATSLPEGPDRTPELMRRLLTRRAMIQGFIIFDHGRHYAEFAGEMAAWVAAGKVRPHEDVVEGLENAPEAFIGLLEGRNRGKLVVKIAE